MPFEQDQAVAEVTKPFLGDYVTTFRSEHGEIIAHLFRRGDWLVAYVSTPTGREYDEITDSYRSELREYARQQGFEDKFRILYRE